MFEKKSIIASAILAGLVSGIALADEAVAPGATEGAKMEKKNECKGKKNECKGMKHEGKKHEGKKHKKGDKNACSGANGCDGTDMKKETTTTTTTEKTETKPAEATAPKAE